MGKLKTRIASLDEIDESIRDAAKVFYVERDGGFDLDADLPDVGGINATLVKERKRARELADQVKQFEGVDLEKYKALLAREEEFSRADEANKGKLSEVLAKYQKDHAVQMDELRTQLKTLQDERDQARQDKVRIQIEREFEEAARKRKVRQAYMDDVRLRAAQAGLVDGKVLMLGADGEPLISPKTGQVVTPDEWLATMEEAKPDWFEASTGGGATGPGPRRLGPRTIDRADRDAFIAHVDKIAKGEVQVR